VSKQARFTLVTGLAIGLVSFGLQADAQTKSSPAAKKATAANVKPDAKPLSGGKAAAGKAAPKSGKAAIATKAVKPAAGAFAATTPTVAYTGPASAGDVANVKEAIALARRGKTSEASQVQQAIVDPVARKVTEWAILRADDNGASFTRYAAFITANPSWPSVGFLRRRAEAMLWQEDGDPATARAFFTGNQPLTAKGHFAYARALLALGDRTGAQAQIRDGWRNDAFSSDLETQVIDMFGGLITAADHKARMDMRLYAEDSDGGLRAASRAGGAAPAIARARIAVMKKASNAKAVLDSVPAEAQRDTGYIFSLAQWLRREERADEAAALILSVPRDPAAAIDTDQWWIERRLIARKLLDMGDAAAAYRVAREAATPGKENYRIEHEFTAGWIALRFLKDPATAQAHFSRISQGVKNPISLARASYWLGRTAEAMGRTDEARRHYQTAAQYPTAYYGQVAGGKLGLKTLVLRAPPARPNAAQMEIVRAFDLLYAVGERDTAAAAGADLGDRSHDAALLAAIGDVAARYKDARAMLLVGKSALSRGLPLDHYAFPTIGIPGYRAIGPSVESPVVYAIARQESTFNQRTVSSAKAMGLMQVTPSAGQYVAKKFNAKFDVNKLRSDPIYNVQLGAAELGDLIADYRGSYILSFVGYNAGRGRVRDWVARFGDPRDPDVDPIDWVERIPFSETRNYVQRVLENLQVYRVRFGGDSKLLIEADLRRGAVAN
jgi:soluble lytic murein transglycosylase